MWSVLLHRPECLSYLGRCIISQRQVAMSSEGEKLKREEAMALFQQAYQNQMQGDLEEAIEECLRAIEVDPTFGNPYNDIGAYLVEKDRLDEAIPWFERALKAPRYESYCFPHFNLGRVHERKRMFGRALAEYKKAYQVNPQHLGALQAVRRLQAMLN